MGVDMRLRPVSLAAGAVLLTGVTVAATSPAGASVPQTRLLHVARVASQTVPSPPSPGSQSDVAVQAQVAANPMRPDLAAAVTIVGLRGTASGTHGTVGVAVTIAVTKDGGATWHARVVPGITTAADGRWPGVSWPNVAIGADGTIYVAAALRSDDPCHTGLGVVTSADAGATFTPMAVVQVHHACGLLEGRSSLAVEDGPAAKHPGRVYLAWTSYRSDASGAPTGQVQSISFADAHARHWSAPVDLTPADRSTYGNTVVVGPDGRVTDVYGISTRNFRQVFLDATTSYDGGRKFAAPVRIAAQRFATDGAADIRCCAPSATVDPVTGVIYASVSDGRYQGGRYDDALVYRSPDGAHWSRPVVADVGGRAGLEHLTPEVAAYAGTVTVTWGLTDDPDGTRIQQQAASSTDGGGSFGPAVDVGPVGDLRYAALAPGFGYWLGDVTGIAAVPGRAYLAWPLPTTPTSTPPPAQHQTLYAATVTVR